MRKLGGISASPGICLGNVVVLQKVSPHIPTDVIQSAEVSSELQRLQDALSETKNALRATLSAAKEKFGAEKAEIFEAHLDILSDPALIESVTGKITQQHQNCSFALNEAIGEFSALFDAMENPYLRERAADVRDVGTQLLNRLLGVSAADLSVLPPDTVLAAHDLVPSDTANMDIKNVLGFVTELGGATAHTSIIARGLGIPAVVGVKGLLEQLSDGDFAIVDGADGQIYINPSADVTAQYQAKKSAEAQEKSKLAAAALAPLLAPNGAPIRICANIGHTRDIPVALANCADGIGLFRTEFLFLAQQRPPSEEAQFLAYREVCQAMAGQAVTIRTLDIGGDKSLPYFSRPAEANPFLGWRGIRFSLDQKELLHTQLRAILRASAFGTIHVMFPMIISLEELRAAKQCVEDCKAALRAEGIAYDENISIGIMIETPAAVLLSSALAQEVDFFSIGTNDLTQYILAVDRGNEQIAHLYNPLHPSVLAAIAMVIHAAHTAGKWVGMCGELAANEDAALLLLGMGLDEFSMSATAIPALKNRLQNADFKHLDKLVTDVLAESSLEGVLGILGTADKKSN